MKVHEPCGSARAPARHCFCAFTILELLVVIAIILVLAALALPVFGALKTRAHAVECIANLRKLHQSMSIYVAENDGRYPVSWYPSSWTGPIDDDGTWERALSKIDFGSERSRELFNPWGQIYDQKGYYCPARKPGSTTALKITYGMNRFIGNKNWNSAEKPTGLKAVQISSPAGIPLIAETLIHNEVAKADLPEGTVRALAFRHNGKCNIVFCDGHVESLTRSEAIAKWPYWNSFDPLR